MLSVSCPQSVGMLWDMLRNMGQLCDLRDKTSSIMGKCKAQ